MQEPSSDALTRLAIAILRTWLAEHAFNGVARRDDTGRCLCALCNRTRKLLCQLDGKPCS